MAQPDQPTLTLVTLFCMFYVSRGWSPAVHGREGGVVELDCSLPSGPSSPGSASPRMVEWVRRGYDTPVLMSFGAHASRVHPEYEGRVSLVRSTSLRVARLMVEDEGAYECQLFLLDHVTNVSRSGNWTQLSVTAPPTFTTTPPSVVEALAGNRLSLSCVAKGNPVPSITWLKDGAGLRDQAVEIQGGTLILRAVTPELRGQYGCRASNPDGNITHVTTLQVKGPPVIVIPPRSASLNMSQNADLTCKAIADPPNMTYVWRKGQENVHHIESLKSRVKIMVDGSLHISTLTPEDSGKYTCMPTNGLLAPPTASADLTVMHPAQALPMPRETYLPTGMRGLITCPFLANPPLLHVDWTKDGAPLDVTLYPGWTMTSEGSLSMATVNEDSAGVYRCTPANSYGSMGPSGATRVLLQGPPSFRSPPQQQYQQEMGRALLIPCQGEGGPDTRVTWRKVIEGPVAPSSQVTGNGSLLLQPLTKGHQGAWECSVSNRVASVSASTLVLVLGTTPHAATSLSVAPGPRVADVSWEPGYDGGSAQIYSVWFKQVSPLNGSPRRDNLSSEEQGTKRQHQGWFNVSVPPASGARHQVTGLAPATHYQFSVLAQNAAGAGPFSELVTVRTLDAPIPRRATLSPPGALSVNRTSTGVILHWAPPPSNRPPITALVLQSRGANGEWLTLDRDINAAAIEFAVPGLRKDSVYELRLLSRRGEVLSEPSPSVNVSTLGLGRAAAPSQLSELVPQPLLAGVLGGVLFMALVLFLLLAATCFVARRRDRRRRKQQNKDDLVRSIYKPSSMRTAGGGSPDSVLKKSLLHAHNLYPATSSSTSSSSSSSSSSSQSHSGNFSKGSPPHSEGQHMELLLPGSLHPHPHHLQPQHHQHHQHQYLLPTPPTPQRRTKSLSRASSSLLSSHLELITRGPDGRFAAPGDGQSLSSALDDEKKGPGRGGRRSSRSSAFQRSASLPSRRGGEAGRRAPCVLSVELPPAPRRAPGPDGRRGARSMTEQHLLALPGHSLWDGADGGSDWRGSLRSSARSSVTAASGAEPGVPPYPGGVAPRTTASSLVLQMEHERERGNLSRCLQLAHEREALQWELRKYTLERGDGAEDGGDGVDGGLEGRVLQERYVGGVGGGGGGGGYLPRLHRDSRASWDLASPVYSNWGAPTPPPLPPRLSPMSASSPGLYPFQRAPRGSSFRGSHAQFPLVSPAKHRDAAAERRPTDRLTLPHLSAERQWPPAGETGPERHSSLRVPRGTRQRNHASTEEKRRRNLSTPSPARDDQYAEHFDAAAAVGSLPRHPKARPAVPKPPPTRVDDTCVEMSVDGPDLEATPAGQRSRVERSDASSSLRRPHKGERGRGPGGTTPLPGHRFEMTPGRHLWKTTSLGAPDAYDYPQRSLSLDHRRRQRARFLTPDDWVDSLSQENCSTPRGPPAPQTPGADAHGPLGPHWPPAQPPETPSSHERSSSSSSVFSAQTPSGEAPSLRRGPPARSPEPAPPAQRDEPKREWSILSMDALRWPANSESWGSGPRPEALKEPSGGSRTLSRARGPTDRGEDPGFPRPLHRGQSWPTADRAPPPLSNGDGAKRDDEKADGQAGGPPGSEVDDVRGYVVVQGSATRGSFSSYASSGRGSMETGNGRMSVCLSPTLSKAPDEVEEYAEDLGPGLDEARRSRKASVDESYEWDEDTSQPETRQFQDPGVSEEVLKGVSLSRCSLVSVQACSLADCSQAALLRGCGTNRRSPQLGAMARPIMKLTHKI
uniref:Immunoglobulin superfamily, member 9a n=1 Tax=Gadus morhua TaxID=8049 RepID=A0A8C5BSZ7_GADMO